MEHFERKSKISSWKMQVKMHSPSAIFLLPPWTYDQGKLILASFSNGEWPIILEWKLHVPSCTCSLHKLLTNRFLHVNGKWAGIPQTLGYTELLINQIRNKLHSGHYLKVFWCVLLWCMRLVTWSIWILWALFTNFKILLFGYRLCNSVIQCLRSLPYA